MQPKGGPRLLVTDRDAAIYLERARVQVEGDRVTYYITDDEDRRIYNIPHVNLAVLFLGQGTSITQSAMRLLGEEGVHLAVTGTGGSPLHIGGLTHYAATRHFRALLPIYTSVDLSLAGAKTIMHHRTQRMRKWGEMQSQKYFQRPDTAPLLRTCTQFSAKTESAQDIAQLLGFEGQFSKECYAHFARMAGLPKGQVFRRDAGAGPSRPDTEGSGDQDLVKRINRMIDHGNYLCYGMAGAALWALGIPPHMSLFHGKTRAGGLVFDLADSFKDALVLPLAFSTSRKKDIEAAEQEFRARLIGLFNDRQILREAIATIETILTSSPERDHA